ncbi:MAG: hypothetical protein XE11_2471 [Methanomicrobiales archaeon 53_19]|nr:MAG: hypothetical protein XD88_1633 [Methanocalculus sp. 52_23]KUL00398.1 MAG: hypothetical protein XE11_2471 [Methanomicrobiales archaeon 53_19]
MISLPDDDSIRIPEIASLLSLSEDLVRQYADEYDDFLPHRIIGKVRIYEQSALKRFRVIADLTSQGLSHEGIVAVLRGGKPLHEIGMDGEMEKKQGGVRSATPPSSPQGSDLLDEIAISSRRTEERTNTIDHRLGAIRDGMAADTDQILREIASLREEVALSRSELRTLWSQVRELEEDLRERELRKSWLERVAKRFSR